MAIDPRIEDAIKEAVDEGQQSKTLARLLAAWFEAVASGNEDISNLEMANRHLEPLYKAVQLDSDSVEFNDAEYSHESVNFEESK